MTIDATQSPDSEKYSADNASLQLFAQKLRELRKKSGLTQEEFAAKAYCSADHITKIERGLRLPSSHLMHSLIQTFSSRGIDREELRDLESLLLACKLGKVKDKASESKAADATKTAGPDADDSFPVKPTVGANGAGGDLAALNLSTPSYVAQLNNLDQPAELFGREAALEELVQVLTDPQINRTVLIAGMGGIGKSTLAYAVARRLVDEGKFEQLIWESAKTLMLNNGEIEPNRFPTAWATFSPYFTFEGLLSSLLLDLGRQDVIDQKGDLDYRLQELTNELQAKPTLIVVDNLDGCNNPKLIYTYLSRIVNQTTSRLIFTSRQAPTNADGYTLQLSGLDNEAAVAFLKHEGRVRNIEAMREEDEAELEEALLEIVGDTGGQPLSMKMVVAQLEVFSLERILENLRTGYSEKMSLRENHKGGLYSYVFRQVWDLLSLSSQNLLAQMKAASGGLAEAELLSQIESSSEMDAMATMDAALKELAHLSLIEVKGGLRKRYFLHPLTRNFLNAGLIEYWQLAGMRI